MRRYPILHLSDILVLGWYGRTDVVRDRPDWVLSRLRVGRDRVSTRK